MISDKIRATLKVAACDLHLKKWDQMHITNDILPGIIATEWNAYSVGGRSGVLFRTQIDCENGTDFMINFLLNEQDLKRGVKIL